MGETCCLCFPLECGVKTLCVLVTIGALSMGGYCYTDVEYRNAFWLELIITSVIALFFIYAAFIKSTEESRKMMHTVWLVLAVVVSTAIYAYVIYDGSAVDYLCTQETVDEINHA